MAWDLHPKFLASHAGARIIPQRCMAKHKGQGTGALLARINRGQGFRKVRVGNSLPEPALSPACPHAAGQQLHIERARQGPAVQLTQEWVSRQPQYRAPAPPMLDHTTGPGLRYHEKVDTPSAVRAAVTAPETARLKECAQHAISTMRTLVCMTNIRGCYTQHGHSTQLSPPPHARNTPGTSGHGCARSYRPSAQSCHPPPLLQNLREQLSHKQAAKAPSSPQQVPTAPGVVATDGFHIQPWRACTCSKIRRR